MKNGEYLLTVAPSNYPGKRYRGRYCSTHTLVYWMHYGIVPNADEIIHHKDGNKRNNNIDNLELMKRRDHVSLHGLAKGQLYVRLRCPMCNRYFSKRRSNTHLANNNRQATFCSRQCVGKFSSLPKEEKERRISEMCIEEYRVFKS